MSEESSVSNAQSAGAPSSPRFAPSSPQYSASSPRYSPPSPQYSASSPQFSPSSPEYVPPSHRVRPAPSPSERPRGVLRAASEFAVTCLACEEHFEPGRVLAHRCTGNCTSVMCDVCVAHLEPNRCVQNCGGCYTATADAELTRELYIAGFSERLRTVEATASEKVLALKGQVDEGRCLVIRMETRMREALEMKEQSDERARTFESENEELRGINEKMKDELLCLNKQIASKAAVIAELQKTSNANEGKRKHECLSDAINAVQEHGGVIKFEAKRRKI